VRSRVLPHAGMFKNPRLFTATIDRKRFKSGADAYDYIRPKLRTFLRLAGFKKAFAVMAFHPKAPEWPHWHFLIDLEDCGGRVDLKRLWAIWRDKWGVGGLDLGLKPVKDGNATAAVRYIVGYCQHQAGVVGQWVLRRKRVPRAFEFYGELRAAIRAASGPASEPGDGAPKRRRASSMRCVGERLQDCGKGSTVMLCRRWRNGRTSFQFSGTLPVTPGRVALADAVGDLPASLGIVRERVDLPYGPGWRLRVSVKLGPEEKADWIFYRLRAAVAGLVAGPARGVVDVAPAEEPGEVCDVPF
jgi:hypothetical protein